MNKWLIIALAVAFAMSGKKTTNKMNQNKLTVCPLKSYRKTSGFGVRMHPVLHKPKHHNGLDMGAPAGAPIYAAGTGIVVYSGYNDKGYGNHVKIDHGDGLTTMYGHMLELPIVAKGSSVIAGQQIGLVGSTGMSTGNHLHFQVEQNGVPINPLVEFHELFE